MNRKVISVGPWHGKFDLSTGSLTSLRIEKSPNLIFPWGLEIGDWISFFSQEIGSRNCKVLKKTITTKKNEVLSQFELILSKGHFLITQHDAFVPSGIVRTSKCLALDNSYLGDFVTRYVFKKEFVRNVIINGYVLYHRKTDKYYQYRTKEAVLVLNDYLLKIKTIEHQLPEKYTYFMYARDEPKDKWIIHARTLAEECDDEFIKIYTLRSDMILPRSLSRSMLKRRTIRRILWRFKERKVIPRIFYYPLSFQAVGNSFIPKNTGILIKTIITKEPKATCF